MNIYVYGFPGLYGGAGTELHHQIITWCKMGGITTHLIPTNPGYPNEPLFKEMQELGVIIHKNDEFDAIEKNAPVMGWCNAEFLDKLPEICKRSTNTVFINCMTWLFNKEKTRMQEGMIKTFLYQNDDVRIKNEPILRALNTKPDIKFITFKPYFEAFKFPYVEHNHAHDITYFNLGHISRQDTDKWAANTLHIYEYITAPRTKRGWFLGFDDRTVRKVGKPYDWIHTFKDQNSGLTQQQFYNNVDIIVQPTDTTENWPRIGFEAMSSGSVLVVDDRGGWQKMVKHGVTGYLCKTQQEFIYYGSKLAFEPDHRLEMAQSAKKWCLELSSFEASAESWKKVFEQLIK